MKTIIIDDDPTSVEQLTQRLKAYDDVTLAGTANNATKGISLVRQEEPDLLFLDVEMPDMSGLDFLEQMGQILHKRCRVVIYTAHDAYMLPAFRNKAFDFLLKPLDEQELQKVMQRYHIEEEKEGDKKQQEPVSHKETEKLLLHVNANEFRVVNIRDVGLFQYNHEQRVWEVLVAGSDAPIRLKRTMNNDALVSMNKRFVQVSQRHIININYLMEVSDSTCRLFPPFDQLTDIKVGRTFRKKLTERFSAL